MLQTQSGSGLVIGSSSGLCLGGRKKEAGWRSCQSLWSPSVALGEFITCWSSAGLVCLCHRVIIGRAVFTLSQPRFREGKGLLWNHIARVGIWVSWQYDKHPKPFPCVPEQTVLTTQALCSAEYLDPLPTPCSRYLCKMLCNLWVGVILMQVGFSLVTQMVKNPPAVQETQVQSLGWKDHLGEGNGNPLQCSCLENSMDRGAW